MRTKTLRQTLTFKAKPLEVYEILMDEKKHAEITESEVTMSKEVKGTFTAFGGYCHGYNIELEKGEKIIQAWHFDEYGWPEEHFSICTFILEEIPEGTRLQLTQKKIPDHKYDELKDGWHTYYWTPMKAYIEAGKHAL